MSGRISDLLEAAPILATQPTPGAKHDLLQIELIAKVLGVPLMPWQKYVARVASERHPDDPNRFRYRTIVLTVPRQSGKTTLMRTILTQRAIMAKIQSFYTAQTGKDATARWKDLVAQIENGFLANYTTTRLAQGAQSLTFDNGSTIAPFAPTPKSLHGYTPDVVMLDEVFEWDEEQGEMLMGAVKPAMQTRRGRQLWIVSTMGTEESTFLDSWLDKGRAAVDDPNSEIAYFEWALEDGLDEYDPNNWDFHPALGWTIQKEDLQEATGNHGRGEWNRAYMNRKTKVAEKWKGDDTLDVITRPLADMPQPSDRSKVHIAWEVDPKRGGGAAMVAAWKNEDGLICAMPFYAEPGRSWVVAEVQAACAGNYGSITHDNTSMNRHYADSISRDQDTALATQDYTAACMMLDELIETKSLVISDDATLRDHVQSVATKPLGEGWAISRTKSTGDVSMAVALAVAVKAAAHVMPAPAPKFRG